jgi:uncharacterized coiled-coil protein SlyX
MDDFREIEHNDERTEKKWDNRAPGSMTRWLVILGLLFVAAAAIGGGYAYKESMATSDLAVENRSLHSTVDQMRNQIGTLTEELNRMVTAPPAQTPATSAPEAKRTASAGSNPQDRRLRKVQSQLAAQQKLLKETQDQIATTKSDLEGQLGSTRDELNGSIARTHDELVSLQKRGERNYYEFDLAKSKDFQREGPIQISLRKADSKHQSYDLMMLVDDHQLSKKRVDLYEPIWLHDSDRPQPVQVVVNRIDKNRIHGYVSAPKYKESELAANTAQPSADVTSRPNSSPSSTSSSNATSSPSSTPATSPQGQKSPVD